MKENGSLMSGLDMASIPTLRIALFKSIKAVGCLERNMDWGELGNLTELDLGLVYVCRGGRHTGKFLSELCIN